MEAIWDLSAAWRLALGAWRVASVVGFHWWMPSPSSGFTERPIVQVELKKEIKPL